MKYYPNPTSPPFGVNYRPGSRLIKMQIFPDVYVVEPGNVRSRIANTDVARELYGEQWGKLIRDIPEVYWPNYIAGDGDLEEALPHDGMLVQKEGDDTIYEVVDEELKEINETLPQFLMDDVRILHN